MKVRVSFVLDVDAETWSQEYGISAAEVREDVKRYVENGAHDHLTDLGLLTETDPS